jgi:transposase-like protein
MQNSLRRGLDQWRQIISGHPASGLSIASYCRSQGISQPSFFAWRRRLADEGGVGFVELTAKATEQGSGCEGVEICLQGQRRLLVRRGFDRDLLIELVRVLEGVA